MKQEIGKFLVILQEDGSLKIIALENKERIVIAPVANNCCVVIATDC